MSDRECWNERLTTSLSPLRSSEKIRWAGNVLFPHVTTIQLLRLEMSYSHTTAQIGAVKERKKKFDKQTSKFCASQERWQIVSWTRSFNEKWEILVICELYLPSCQEWHEPFSQELDIIYCVSGTWASQQRKQGLCFKRYGGCLLAIIHQQ